MKQKIEESIQYDWLRVIKGIERYFENDDEMSEETYDAIKTACSTTYMYVKH